MIEFPFLWDWNIEDTVNHLNEPNFINFTGRNLGLTKKELLCEPYLWEVPND